MTKILIDEAVVRQAMEDLEFFKELSLSVREIERAEESITALNRAIANEALDQMADNARELGLGYEQPAPSDMKQAIIEEASIQMTGHPSKDARFFAKSVYEYLMAEQPAKDEFKAAYIEAMVASNEAGFSGMSAAETIRELSRMVAEQPAQQKPVAFEEWLAKQHGDPEEIGFLQALRIAYNAGQDSITKGNT